MAPFRWLWTLLVVGGCAASAPSTPRTPPAFTQPADDGEALKATIAALEPQLERCVASVQGVEVEMTLSIERDGVVFPQVHAANTDDPAIHRCLYQTAREWRLKRPPGAWARNAALRVTSPDRPAGPVEVTLASWNLFGWTHGRDYAVLGNASLICLGPDGGIQTLLVLEDAPGMPTQVDRAKRLYTLILKKRSPPPSQPYCRTVGSIVSAPPR